MQQMSTWDFLCLLFDIIWYSNICPYVLGMICTYSQVSKLNTTLWYKMNAWNSQIVTFQFEPCPIGSKLRGAMPTN